MSSGVVNFRAVIIEESGILHTEALSIESVDPYISGDIYVDMGRVSESQFTGIGSSTVPVIFEIRFDNQDVEKVRITFSGVSSDVISGVLKSTNASVGIQLRDESGVDFPINESREYSLYPGLNVIWFSSSLIATDREVLPGNLGAIAEFTLDYQ